METFVWGAWLKWAFLVLLIVLFVWAVIAVKRATVGRGEGFFGRHGRRAPPKKGV